MAKVSISVDKFYFDVCVEVVEELVAREASLDSQNKLGRTAIMQAVAQAVR